MLKQSLDPDCTNVVPSNVNAVVTRLQPFTSYLSYNGNWQTSGSITPTSGEAVRSSSSNAVIWNPALGMDTLRRLAEVTEGTINPLVFQLPALHFPFFSFSFTLLKAIFLPFQTGEQIPQAPSGSYAYVVGRVVSGYVDIKSDSTSTTTAALSGSVTCGVMNDLRNMDKITVSDIGEQTINKKDLQLNAKIQGGIRALVGGDISSFLNLPIYELSVRRANVKVMKWETAIPVAHTPLITNLQIGVVWVSPYIRCNSTFSNFASFSSPAVGVFEAPGYILNFQISNNDVLATSNNVSVHVINYYGTLTSSNQAGLGFGFNIVNTCNSVVLSTFKVSGPVSGPFSQTFHAECVIDNMQPIKDAVWVGSHIVVEMSDQTDKEIICTLVGVQLLTTQSVSNLGPYRVARIDNVAIGQNIVVSSKIFVEAVPTTNVGPFIGPPSVVCDDPNVLPLMKKLYDDVNDREIKRVYKWDDYVNTAQHLDSLIVDDRRVNKKRKLDNER